uniref:Uncharacterized protein n=1 Tax=viral metagenome TaxID=1070528 RepID=A0A6C0BMA6_9ZZZZ
MSLISPGDSNINVDHREIAPSIQMMSSNTLTVMYPRLYDYTCSS